jgi:hypothetical protein
MNIFLSLAPFLIPIVAAAVVFFGRRSEEDEKAAIALGCVTTAGCIISVMRQETFGGYFMAIMAGLTAVGLIAYTVYRRQQAI